MRISRGLLLASLMTLAASPVFAGFNLGDVAGAIAGAQGNKAGEAATTPQAAGLLDTLGSQLNVSPEQAVGGAGAMLGLAKNRLSSTDYAQLAKSVPGLDQLTGNNALGGLGGLGGLLGDSAKSPALDGLLGNVKNTNDLNNTFGALGMDSGMIGQFAPLILQYLGQQGVGGSLLQSLSGIWGTGS
ncbi:DUF2780 domain-containing protein [Pseudomonas sp. MF4836]|uniref:DUF2780 domain-containing protein n=1 Tax=Pseudomonas sp. MF4836 TaxID=1960827 RepID=UPI0009975967|nr:DUF2780 domain-containing protein [Pseudomonas sp. MF4836]OOV91718.1 hypothetical protein MF4836_26525 [Pseudomonas sp. MF4836]